MSKALPLLLFLLLFGVVPHMAAQNPHTFTFGVFTTPGCAGFQTIDGQPANEAAGFAGNLCVPYNDNPWWGLQAPQVWGFPNNGFLTNNTTSPQLSAPVFTAQGCNLKTAGCVNYETATAAFTGSGVTLEITVWFVVNKHSRFGRGCYPCVYYTNDETNGAGTASD